MIMQTVLDRLTICAGYGSTTPNRQLCEDAAAEIKRLTAERDTARAETAAMGEAAAQAADCGCAKDRSDCLCVSGDVPMCYRDGVADIRALIPDVASATLARLLAEAEAKGVERALRWVSIAPISGKTVEQVEAMNEGRIMAVSEARELMAQAAADALSPKRVDDRIAPDDGRKWK